MKINSKLLFWLVVAFAILNLADGITAMFILPGESNPIYLLTHSMSALWIFKVFYLGVVFWIYFKNEYPSKWWLFNYTYIMIIGCLVIGLGVYSNMVGILNPEVVTAAAQVSTAEKMSYYSTIMSIVLIIPYFISMVAFKAYEKIEKSIKYKQK